MVFRIIWKAMTFPRANVSSVSLFRGTLGKSEGQLFYRGTSLVPLLWALSCLFQPCRNMGFFFKSLQLTRSHKTVLLECFHTLSSLLSPLVLPAFFAFLLPISS